MDSGNMNGGECCMILAPTGLGLLPSQPQFSFILINLNFLTFLFSDSWSNPIMERRLSKWKEKGRRGGNGKYGKWMKSGCWKYSKPEYSAENIHSLLKGEEDSTPAGVPTYVPAGQWRAWCILGHISGKTLGTGGLLKALALDWFKNFLLCLSITARICE